MTWGLLLRGGVDASVADCWWRHRVHLDEGSEWIRGLSDSLVATFRLDEWRCGIHLKARVGAAEGGTSIRRGQIDLVDVLECRGGVSCGAQF